MRCWSPWCPSVTMCPWDSRVCWIHAIRYVIKGEPLPLSVVPLQELVRKMQTRQHPEFPGKTWSAELVAEEIGVSRKHVERLLCGRDQPQSLKLHVAERWADRFKLHPFDIWGDAYLAIVNERAAA